MVRPLSMKERGEVIGLALDIDADAYNDFLDNNMNSFNFKGSESDKRVAAAIALVYTAALFDFDGSGGKDYRKEHDDFYMSLWGRAILYETKHNNENMLKIFPNKKKARAEFNK